MLRENGKHKKIFIVTYSYPDENGFQGGVFIHNQAVAIKNGGADVAVLLFDFRSIRKKRKIGLSKYVIDGINVYRCSFPCGPFPLILELLSRFFVFKLLKFAIKQEGVPDYFHAHFFDAGYLCSIITKKYHIPYFVTEHSSGYLSKTLKKRDYINAKKAYEKAELVITVGSQLEKEIKKFSNCKTTVIPNIIPDYFFDYSANKNKKNNSEYFTFVSIGNLISRKRFDLTINSFSSVKNSNLNAKVRLIIVGEGPCRNNLETIIDNLNLRDDVVFLGNVPNNLLPKILSDCDCFVLPSDFETFGMVYAEAMACGLPVVATKCGGPEDFINCDNGILVKKNDVSCLTNALNHILTNRFNYNSDFIIELCKNRFSQKAVGMKLLEIYDGKVSN